MKTTKQLDEKIEELKKASENNVTRKYDIIILEHEVESESIKSCHAKLMEILEDHERFGCYKQSEQMQEMIKTICGELKQRVTEELIGIEKEK